MAVESHAWWLLHLQEFSAGLVEGERKLKAVVDSAAKTARNTSAQGQDVLRREVDHLQREWDDYRGHMVSAEHALDQTMVQWGSFESKFEECAEWLKNMENSVKSHELKNTLKEKQAQVDKFKVHSCFVLLYYWWFVTG